MKYIYSTIVAALLVLALASGARAEVQNTEAGSVVVLAADELGTALFGFTVQARFPYEDGELDNDMDIVVTKTDGKDDDVKKMKSATEDGDVEISAQIAKRAAPNGGQFEVSVSTPGYVETKTRLEFSSSDINRVKLSQKYILKVVVNDNAGKALAGAEISVNGGAFMADGGDMDADGTANGILYVYSYDMKDANDKDVKIRARYGKREYSGLFPVSKKVQKPVIVTL